MAKNNDEDFKLIYFNKDEKQGLRIVLHNINHEPTFFFSGITNAENLSVEQKQWIQDEKEDYEALGFKHDLTQEKALQDHGDLGAITNSSTHSDLKPQGILDKIIEDLHKIPPKFPSPDVNTTPHHIPDHSPESYYVKRGKLNVLYFKGDDAWQKTPKKALQIIVNPEEKTFYIKNKTKEHSQWIEEKTSYLKAFLNEETKETIVIRKGKSKTDLNAIASPTGVDARAFSPIPPSRQLSSPPKVVRKRTQNGSSRNATKVPKPLSL